MDPTALLRRGRGTRAGTSARPGVPGPARVTSARVGLGLLVPAALLVLWWLVAGSGAVTTLLLPTPEQVGRSAVRLFLVEQTGPVPGVIPYDGAGWAHLGASLRRTLIGFSLAALVGVAGGLALGLSRRLSMLLDPLLNGLRAIPLYAWLPIILVWFGIGESATRALIFLGALWPVLLATTDAVQRVPASHVETARMLGSSRHRLWRDVYLPAALPEIVTGLRLGLTLAWMCVIVGELSGTTTGVGAMMNAARETGRVDQILVGMALFAAVGFAADRVLRVATRPLTRWRSG